MIECKEQHEKAAHATEYASVIKGVCVAVVLMSVGLEINDLEWWVSMLALNIALNI